MSQEPQSLARIGRYELLERIGVGGMGEVFLARTTGPGGFEKQVVIKKILPHLVDNPSFVQRFTDEGRLVVQLRHAGIAQILDMGEESGVTFIAMEHVDGRDLRDLLRLARLAGVAPPVAVVTGILIRILEALDYAHAKTGDDGRPLGIIHRDVSPSNIMISRSGEVKLVDFGIARATDRLGNSVSGAVQGKFAYMSPQQAAGAALDARSDQFAVGVVAWELLGRPRPFDGATDLETLDRIRHHAQPSLAQLDPSLPPELAATIDRMLAKSPDERFPSAGDAARALHGYLFRVGELVGTREIGAWVSAVMAATPDALRAPSAAGLSLDDALRISLEGKAPARAFATVSVVASEPVPAAFVTRDVLLAPGTSAPTPTPATPSAAFPPGYADLTPASAAASGTPLPPALVTDGVTVPPPAPPGRRVLGAFGLLIALNVLLLASVGYLLWLSFGPDSTSPEVAAASRATTVQAAPASTAPPTPAAAGPTDGGQPEIAPAPAERIAAPAEVAPAPAEVAPDSADAPDLGTAGRQTGLALASLTLPKPRSETDTAKNPATASPKPAAALGAVSFRYYPANADVYIDGRPVPKTGSNLVRDLSVPVGAHVLLVSASPAFEKRVPFTVTEGKTNNLGQITVDTGASTDEP
ncbi:MAG: protein kinase [Myxococcota bacterium]